MLSDELRARAAEQGVDDGALGITVGRLAAYGYLSIRSDTGGAALLLEAERARAIVTIRPGETVLATLERVVQAASDGDHAIRFHFAALDMHSVATTCRQMVSNNLATPEQNPPLWRLLQAGIHVVYARPFSGNAEIGGRWRPEGEEQRVLHDELLKGRSKIFAHANHTPHRAALYLEGVLNLVEPGIHPDVLPDVAAMCETQAARFQTEADRLLASVSAVLVPSGSLSETFGTQPPSSAKGERGG